MPAIIVNDYEEDVEKSKMELEASEVTYYDGSKVSELEYTTH